MKVLLINAPTKFAAVTTSDWDTTAEDIGAFPPIGLSYLAGYLLTNTSHDVRILDSLALRLDYAEIEQEVAKANPDVVGVTAFTPTFYDVLMICRICKKLYPDVPVVLGGSHVNTFPEETLSHPEVDILVHGEGEIIFAELIAAIESGGDLDSVKGISFKRDGRTVNTGEGGYVKDIDTLPPPAFDLLPLDRYTSAIGTGEITGVIASSRGCPYFCTYCNRPYRTYRQYSVDRIISEMRYHYDRGVREFMFFDDMFNLKPKRVINISRRIKEEFPGIVWSFRGRVDQVTEEMIREARDSGCRQILYGVEAATDDDLRAIKKKITTQQVVDAIRITRRHGLETSTNWIIGLPTHKSRKDVLTLLDFAIRCGTDYAQFNILIPYIETPIFADGVARGVLPADFWSDYVRNPRPNASIPIWEEYLSRGELSELLKLCYRKFYFRPGRILHQLRSIRSFSQFKSRVRGAMTILGFGGVNQKERSKKTTASE